MKIVFFTDTYTPQINGVVTAIKLFSEELRKKGHKVYIFCPKAKRQKKDKFIYRIPSFKFKPYPEYRGSIPTPKMLALIRKINPDIIHVHTPASIGFTGMVIARYLKIPLVMTYHTLLEEYFKYFLLSLRGRKRIESQAEKMMKKFTRFFYNKADLVITPSSAIKKLLEDENVKRPIEILPNGIKLKKLKKTKKKDKTVLYVGRIGKEKSIDVLLKSFKELLKRIDCKFMIVGDGPDRGRLEKLARKMRIENKVEFTGYIDYEKLMDYYSIADVFVSASVTETQGLTILESFVCGCPVVVSDALGFKDVVENGKNGFLVKPNNLKEFSNRIYQILKNKRLRDKLSKQAKKTAKLYTISNCSKNLVHTYKKLIKQKNLPKISIIIPALNEEKYIEKTLKAVLNQSYKNFEIIVVDNGSTDRTSDIAKKYADTVLFCKEKGISKARNTGGKIATGDILLFLDADTVIKRDFLKNMLDKFKSPNVIGVSGYIETYGKRLHVITFRLCSEIAWLSTLLRNPMFYGMCMAYRRSVFEKIKFDENLPTAEDIDFTKKARKFGKCVLARNARAITSPRRVEEMGLDKAVLFHLKNFFNYTFFKKAKSDYPEAR